VSELQVGLHERFLGQVSGGLEVMGQVVPEPIDHVPVAIDEIAEGFWVSFLHPLHELSIRHSHRSSLIPHLQGHGFGGQGNIAFDNPRLSPASRPCWPEASYGTGCA
jgi:hypothetical protein